MTVGDKRRLYHYENAETAAKWPVAVGTGGSPTPTGRFTPYERVPVGTPIVSVPA
jgi:hypothetical protein